MKWSRRSRPDDGSRPREWPGRGREIQDSSRGVRQGHWVGPRRNATG
jgi:hypothetical protein